MVISFFLQKFKKADGRTRQEKRIIFYQPLQREYSSRRIRRRLQKYKSALIVSPASYCVVFEIGYVFESKHKPNEATTVPLRVALQQFGNGFTFLATITAVHPSFSTISSTNFCLTFVLSITTGNMTVRKCRVTFRVAG